MHMLALITAMHAHAGINHTHAHTHACTHSMSRDEVVIAHTNGCVCFFFIQVPKDHVDEFKSIKKFKIFNTNNLWARLGAIDNLLSSKNADFEVIANKKARTCCTSVCVFVVVVVVLFVAPCCFGSDCD